MRAPKPRIVIEVLRPPAAAGESERWRLVWEGTGRVRAALAVWVWVCLLASDLPLRMRR